MCLADAQPVDANTGKAQRRDQDPGAAGVGAAATRARLQRNAAHPIGTGGTRPIDPATRQPGTGQPPRGLGPPGTPVSHGPRPSVRVFGNRFHIILAQIFGGRSCKTVEQRSAGGVRGTPRASTYGAALYESSHTPAFELPETAWVPSSHWLDASRTEGDTWCRGKQILSMRSGRAGNGWVYKGSDPGG